MDQLASLQDLVKDLDAGAVDLLLILGGNPAFNAPVELGMRDRLQKAQHARAPEPLRRRDFRGLPVASARGALPGNLGRRARVRRHGHASSSRSSSRCTTAARRTRCWQMLTEHARSSAATRSCKGYWAAPAYGGADFEAWWRRAVHDGVMAGYGAARQDPGAARRGHRGSARRQRARAASWK